LKVVILAGGYGTRIRDVVDDIPKPMISIGPLPILWHIMKIYSKFGYKEFVICLGYKGQVIKDFFLNYKNHTRDLTIDFASDNSIEYHGKQDESDWKVTLADTGLRSMTGSRISKIRDYINEDEFMLTYGDGVGDVNINNLVDFHRSHDKILTVTGVRPPSRFGEVVADQNGTVTQFNEKPQASAGCISSGFFVANAKLFDYLDDSEELVFEQKPMNNLVQNGQLVVYEHTGFWQPMDTSREYHYLNSLYNSGKAPWIDKNKD
jgi:glucose-1-phosphate cytidylyltransferase